MSQDQTNCKLVAILKAKVVRYNRLVKKDEEWAFLQLNENKKLMSDIIYDYKGQVIDSGENGLLACFCSSINAVECAVKIQQNLKKKCSESTGNPDMDFCIGIDIVETVEDGSAGYSNDISTDHRLNTITKQGGICISRRVHNHVNTKLDLSYVYLGEFNVKNVNVPMWIYRVVPDNTVGPEYIASKRSTGVMSHKRIIIVFAVLIFIAAGFAKFVLHKHRSENINNLSMESGQMILVFNFMESAKTLAVLPSYDSTPDNSQNEFAASVIENIFSSFCRVPDLSTVEKKQCIAFKGAKNEIRIIADRLGVDYIVAVKLRKSENILRLSAQFIDAYDESQICLKAYNLEMNDEKMNEISEDLAISIVKECKEILENKKYI